MALIDTDKIAQQFGAEAAKVVEDISNNGLKTLKSVGDYLETKDLVITIRLQDR